MAVAASVRDLRRDDPDMFRGRIINEDHRIVTKKELMELTGLSSGTFSQARAEQGRRR